MIIDGKKIAEERLEKLREKIAEGNFKIKLATILVGNDPASEMYVLMKKKKAEEVGICCDVLRFDVTVDTEELIKRIEVLNKDESVSGILVQLPLPENIDTDRVLDSIDIKKDVDGLTGKSNFLPATVKAVLIVTSDLKNKTVVVVGQGKLIGKPLSDYLEKEGIRVIRCDMFTKDLKSETLKGDVLISATGVSGLIKMDMVKRGAIVIDCGAPKAEVDFENVSKIASAITPVPGGIGPLTVVSLLENLVSNQKS